MKWAGQEGQVVITRRIECVPFPAVCHGPSLALWPHAPESRQLAECFLSCSPGSPVGQSSAWLQGLLLASAARPTPAPPILGLLGEAAAQGLSESSSPGAAAHLSSEPTAARAGHEFSSKSATPASAPHAEQEA